MKHNRSQSSPVIVPDVASAPVLQVVAIAALVYVTSKVIDQPMAHLAASEGSTLVTL